MPVVHMTQDESDFLCFERCRNSDLEITEIVHSLSSQSSFFLNELKLVDSIGSPSSQIVCNQRSHHGHESVPLAGSEEFRALTETLIHLLDCLAQIRTNEGRRIVLAAGAVTTLSGLMSRLNEECRAKMTYVTECVTRVKEAVCFALWAFLDRFPEGQWEFCHADGIKSLVKCLLLNRKANRDQSVNLEVSGTGAICGFVSDPAAAISPSESGISTTSKSLLLAGGHRLLVDILEDIRADPRARSNAASALRNLMAGNPLAQRRVLSVGGARALVLFLHVSGLKPLPAHSPVSIPDNSSRLRMTVTSPKRGSSWNSNAPLCLHGPNSTSPNSPPPAQHATRPKMQFRPGSTSSHSEPNLHAVRSAAGQTPLLSPGAYTGGHQRAWSPRIYDSLESDCKDTGNHPINPYRGSSSSRNLNSSSNNPSRASSLPPSSSPPIPGRPGQPTDTSAAGSSGPVTHHLGVAASGMLPVAHWVQPESGAGASADARLAALNDEYTFSDSLISRTGLAGAPPRPVALAGAFNAIAPAAAFLNRPALASPHQRSWRSVASGMETASAGAGLMWGGEGGLTGGYENVVECEAKEQTAAALWNLAVGYPAAQLAIVEAGGIKKLLECITGTRGIPNVPSSPTGSKSSPGQAVSAAKKTTVHAAITLNSSARCRDSPNLRSSPSQERTATAEAASGTGNASPHRCATAVASVTRIAADDRPLCRPEAYRTSGYEAYVESGLGALRVLLGHNSEPNSAANAETRREAEAASTAAQRALLENGGHVVLVHFLEVGSVPVRIQAMGALAALKPEASIQRVLLSLHVHTAAAFHLQAAVEALTSSLQREASAMLLSGMAASLEDNLNKSDLSSTWHLNLKMAIYSSGCIANLMRKNSRSKKAFFDLEIVVPALLRIIAHLQVEDRFDEPDIPFGTQIGRISARDSGLSDPRNSASKRPARLSISSQQSRRSIQSDSRDTSAMALTALYNAIVAKFCGGPEWQAALAAALAAVRPGRTQFVHLGGVRPLVEILTTKMSAPLSTRVHALVCLRILLEVKESNIYSSTSVSNEHGTLASPAPTGSPSASMQGILRDVSPFTWEEGDSPGPNGPTEPCDQGIGSMAAGVDIDQQLAASAAETVMELLGDHHILNILLAPLGYCHGPAASNAFGTQRPHTARASSSESYIPLFSISGNPSTSSSRLPAGNNGMIAGTESDIAESISEAAATLKALVAAAAPRHRHRLHSELLWTCGSFAFRPTAADSARRRAAAGGPGPGRGVQRPPRAVGVVGRLGSSGGPVGDEEEQRVVDACVACIDSLAEYSMECARSSR